jgi:hypothetical protein
VSITLDLYSDGLPDMQRDAMEAMARLFEGVRDKTVAAVSQPGQLPTASPHAVEDESDASGEQRSTDDIPDCRAASHPLPEGAKHYELARSFVRRDAGGERQVPVSIATREHAAQPR